MKTRLTIALVATALAALLGASLAGANATERVNNGGFEAGTGTGAPPWAFTGAQACSNATCGKPASEGTRYASTGIGFDPIAAGVSNSTVGEITQSVVVPESPFRLALDMRRTESGDPPNIDLQISLDGSNLVTYSDDFIPTTFGRFSVDIPSGFTSLASQTLSLKVVCHNTAGAIQYNCDRIDIDDVSLITGTSPAAPTITGTNPASPADNERPRIKGTLGAGGPNTVEIYRGPSCDTFVTSGPASVFAAAGIPVVVEEGSTSTFTAKAVNLAGPSACSNSITYRDLRDTKGPTLQLSGKRSQKLGKTVKVGARCTDEDCSLVATGKLTATYRSHGRRIKKTFRLNRTSKFALEDQARTLKLGTSAKARAAARRALSHGGSVTASLLVTALDGVSNRTRKTRSVRLH